MEYREKLSWILDKTDRSMKDEEQYQANIDFVHSLGLKCDCVGWSELDMGAPNAAEILDKIEEFCREEGWQARGILDREYINLQSEWYQIYTNPCSTDDTVSWWEPAKAPFDDGHTYSVGTAMAYKNRSSAPHWLPGYLIVPERFHDACIASKVEGVDFCWVRDVGRYAAEQYFMVFPERQLPHIGTGKGLNVERFNPGESIFKRIGMTLQRPARYRALGGALPRLGELFYDLQVHLPCVYLKEDMPSGGMVYAYSDCSYGRSGWYEVLVHRDIAEMLLREKAITDRSLLPVPVVNEWPGGYAVEPCERRPRPTQAYMDEMLEKFRKLKASPRPERKATEKLAVKQLRDAKKEETERFTKRLPKKQAEQLAGTAYEPLLPYYAVSNGGELSDEYDFLSPDEAQ